MDVPMEVEVCGSCGCSEFAHTLQPTPCGPDCEPDCDGYHDDDSAWECECGACDGLYYMDDPHALLCRCGCPEDRHSSEDGESPDEWTAGLRPCESCDCEDYREAGTALEVLHRRLGRLPAVGVADSGNPVIEVRTDWFDGPLRLAGTLVADPDGHPVRIDEPPEPGDRVLLYLAVTDDGLEVAIPPDEVV